MALTAAEEERIQELEETVVRLTKLMQGSGSKNQLNRLLILAQEEVRKLTTQLEPIEADTEECLALARKLQ